MNDKMRSPESGTRKGTIGTEDSESPNRGSFPNPALGAAYVCWLPPSERKLAPLFFAILFADCLRIVPKLSALCRANAFILFILNALVLTLDHSPLDGVHPPIC